MKRISFSFCFFFPDPAATLQSTDFKTRSCSSPDVFAYEYITNCCVQLFSLLFSILSERGPQLRCLFFQTCFALYPSLKPRSRISLSESALNITSAACYESSAIKMPTFKRSSTSDCNVTPPSIRRCEYFTTSNNRVVLEYKPL